MLARARVVVIASAATLVFAFACDAVAQSVAATAGADQQNLAAQLTSGTEEQRAAAAVAVLRIPVEQRGASLLDALIVEAERLKRDLDERGAALAAGRPIAPARDEGEHLFNVLEALCQSKDPRVIHSLASLMHGNRVLNALVKFGELAAPDVMSVAEASTSSPTEVDSALIVLRRMLEQPGDHPLSESSKARIAQIAARRLSGTQQSTVVSSAIGLAATTHDSELLRRVQELARDEANIRALGIADEQQVSRLQKIAQDAAVSR
ncbi:MAG TPA: hypothetical protein VFS52_15795 [Steroidobacteraceae bacterium]|nr:hypothetical protein [Steroidobacteraceae bacterium]